MHLSEQSVRAALSDLEARYVAFMIDHFRNWRVWADASQRMADGIPVLREEIPEAFAIEYEFAKAVLEMEHQGGFNWNDPRLRKIFAAVAQGPFYTFWADMITEVVLRLTPLFNVKTLLEAGAGRANLTVVMLEKLAARAADILLVTTDAHPVVLDSIGKLREQYPSIRQTTCLWDITQKPPQPLLDILQPPVLLYERATITYANWQALNNFAVADVVVLGDYFNYTGTLYAYDMIFEKIGVKPLLYQEVKPVLDACFPYQYIMDARVVEEIGLPNVTLTVAWR
ncbi:MAG: hypothetical protein N3B18_12360 [Desulfobacterota bacterium]|nr:hypothetical protein [Thermodesulfobacteriota bacterium]